MLIVRNALSKQLVLAIAASVIGDGKNILTFDEASTIKRLSEGTIRQDDIDLYVKENTSDGITRFFSVNKKR